MWTRKGEGGRLDLDFGVPTHLAHLALTGKLWCEPLVSLTLDTRSFTMRSESPASLCNLHTLCTLFCHTGNLVPLVLHLSLPPSPSSALFQLPFSLSLFLSFLPSPSFSPPRHPFRIICHSAVPSEVHSGLYFTTAQQECNRKI